MTKRPLYRPILRWKAGERAALLEADRRARDVVAPIVELIKPQAGGGHLETSAKQFADDLKKVDLQHPVTIDLTNWTKYLSPQARSKLLADYLKACLNAGIGAHPSIRLLGGLDEARFLRKTLAHDLHGASLRIDLVALGSRQLETQVNQTLDALALRADKVSVVIDAGESYSEHPTIDEATFKVRRLHSFRDITYAEGAFPHLDFLRSNSSTEPVRHDWGKWESWLYAHGRKYAVGYSDYTVLPAAYSTPPEHCTPRLTSRFAQEGSWLVQRGTTLADGGSVQWEGHAEALVETGICKPNCCFGCDSVARIAQRDGGRGNFTNWTSFAVSHHLALTVSQIERALEKAAREAA